MADKKPPPLIFADVDVQDVLIFLVGETGEVIHSMGGFKIRIFHTRAFPWDDVLKTLVYHDFKVFVTRHKADLIIEASI